MKSEADEIRRRGQAAGWGTPRIAAAIVSALPDLRPLEAWRLAYGWSRPEAIASVCALYERVQLAPPALNTAMLCRWEHGEITPSAEYAEALSRLYQVRPDQLGLLRHPLSALSPVAERRPGRPDQPGPGVGAGQWSGAAAVRESVQLAWQAEGPGGGPMTRDQLHGAVRYYDLNYSLFPPRLLAAEVHQCRAAVTAMLNLAQPLDVRRRLLQLGVCFSGLLGNLAMHAADYRAAEIHLDAAAGVARSIDYQRLLYWATAAQSMLACRQGRADRALDLARQAAAQANSPLRRAQVLSWTLIPACIRAHRHGEARDAMTAAQRELDASDIQARPGRFGFDRAELELHLAEAAWGLGDTLAAQSHARESLRHATSGRPGWVAATVVLARVLAARGHAEQGADLGLSVLDAVPTEALRDTAWRRLAALDRELTVPGAGGAAATDLRERLRDPQAQAAAGAGRAVSVS